MTRIIKYVFETPYPSIQDMGEIEVSDDATRDEIDAEVREIFFERYNYGWSEEGNTQEVRNEQD